jgi:uncharacterized protein (TIGR03382 family)
MRKLDDMTRAEIEPPALQRRGCTTEAPTPAIPLLVLASILALGRRRRE